MLGSSADVGSASEHAFAAVRTMASWTHSRGTGQASRIVRPRPRVSTRSAAWKRSRRCTTDWPGWLDAWRIEERLELKLPYAGDEVRVTVERDEVLGVAAGFYRGVAQLVAQNAEPDRGLVVLVSDRLARLPGPRRLARTNRTTHASKRSSRPRRAQRAARSAASQWCRCEIAEASAVARGRPCRSTRARAALPAPSAVASESRATHVVHGGTAYRVGASGIVVGRETDGARRTIMVPDNHSGVSRVHAEVTAARRRAEAS